MISRFKPSAWVAAVSHDPAVCQALVFSYGVSPVLVVQEPESWRDFAVRWVREQKVPGAIAMLAAGPSDRHPDSNYRIEFMPVGERPARPAARKS
jgi:pyruvate kinase